MEIYITPVNYKNENMMDICVNLVKNCPLCHNAIMANVLGAYMNKNVLTITHSCPACESFFISLYIDPYCSGAYECLSSYPNNPEEHKFSECISELSPAFVKIYNQALAAEEKHLTEICGLGYRKALEFLVKDYAISIKPEKEEEIKKSFLAACISTYISREHIKTLAKACTWLGNDQTHYVRKNQNHGIDELKAFIQTLISYMEEEFNLKKAEELIGSNT